MRKTFIFNYRVVNFKTMSNESGTIEVEHFTLGEACSEASDRLDFRYPSKKGYLVEIGEDYTEVN